MINILDGVPVNAASAGVWVQQPRGLVTLNVQHAAASRASRQIDWLASLDMADIVVLTEVPALGTCHRRALDRLGYYTAGGEQFNDYGVIVATRIGELRPVTLYAGVLPHRLVAATIHPDHGAPLGVVGLYVPSRGPKHRRNVDKRAFQRDVTDTLNRIPVAFGTAAVMVIGDLNVVEHGHQPHHPVFGQWEYEFYGAFAANGLIDGYRLHHPDTVDHSWFGRSGNGYRFDHLFITAAHQTLLADCRYLHASRNDGLSDHSALAAQLLFHRYGALRTRLADPVADAIPHGLVTARHYPSELSDGLT